MYAGPWGWLGSFICEVGVTRYVVFTAFEKVGVTSAC